MNYTATKDKKDLFRLEKEIIANKHRILRHIKNISEHEEDENYYKPVRICNIWSNNCVK